MRSVTRIVSVLAMAVMLCSGCTIGGGQSTAGRTPATPSGLVDEPLLHADPVVKTDPVSVDADDPAIWVNPDDPAKSLIIGTNKTPAPEGGLAVYDLDGNMLHFFDVDKPNNVDVEYDLKLAGKTTDIAVCTERRSNSLRVLAIHPGGSLVDIGAPVGLKVFQGQEERRAEPMGIALYRRPSDGAIFAIVSRKAGPEEDYLWQYRLHDNGSGQVAATKVREFGTFSGVAFTEIEAVAVDDALGYVYYADEDSAIHKWHADPDHPDADRELAVFGKWGFTGEREGIAVYAREGGGGYVICCDQIPPEQAPSQYHLYNRRGTITAPHSHQLMVVFEGGAKETDGIDATSRPLGPRFPEGILVVMNTTGRNFFIYDWRDVIR